MMLRGVGSFWKEAKWMTSGWHSSPDFSQGTSALPGIESYHASSLPFDWPPWLISLPPKNVAPWLCRGWTCISVKLHCRHAASAASPVSPHHTLPSLLQRTHWVAAACSLAKDGWLLPLLNVGAGKESPGTGCWTWSWRDTGRWQAWLECPPVHHAASWQRAAHPRRMEMHPVCQDCTFILFWREMWF